MAKLKDPEFALVASQFFHTMRVLNALPTHEEAQQRRAAGETSATEAIENFILKWQPKVDSNNVIADFRLSLAQAISEWADASVAHFIRNNRLNIPHAHTVETDR